MSTTENNTPQDLSLTHKTILSLNSAEEAEGKLRDLCDNGHDEEKKFNDRLSRIKSKLNGKGKKRTTFLQKKTNGNSKA